MWRPYGDGGDDEDVVAEAARLSDRDLWLFCNFEAELQQGSRVLLQSGLGQSIPNKPLEVRRKMNIGGGRHVNWSDRYRDELFVWNSGGVPAVPYDHEGRQFDPFYFESYWEPMRRNRKIEKIVNPCLPTVPSHVVAQPLQPKRRLALVNTTSPSVTNHEEDRTLAPKEKTVSAARLELIERENKKLRTEVSTMGTQLNAVVDMMTSLLRQGLATRRPPRIDSPPIKSERQVYEISSDSSSDSE